MKHVRLGFSLLFLFPGLSLLVGQNLGSLKKVPVPQPAGADKYIQDTKPLIALGKALFWDMQAGSDGRTACATCHFHAGADHRTQNQLSSVAGPLTVNYTLVDSDFPFHIVSNPASNRSTVVRDSSAVTGSSGVLRRLFSDLRLGSGAESGSDLVGGSMYAIGGLNTRQVTPRNTPTIFNAVFNVRNFWDGRASDVFTGATPFGDSDKSPHALRVIDATPTLEPVRVTNASLASQAVGPALSDVEMSYSGKSWPLIGKKMLALRPLALQQVAADDSVLGPLSDASGRGLAQQNSYLSLIQLAFRPEYWNSDQLVDASGNLLGRVGPPQGTAEFTVAEFNFSLFWGLAIQAYETTLITDDSPVDRFFDGDGTALTAQEQRGIQVFQGRTDCTRCHVGPETTAASFTALLQNGAFQRGGGRNGADTGFFRTGVRPTAEDVGLAGLDAFGNPMSRAVVLDPANLNTVRGLFKVPGLRNVEFTGPYQHNGGQATLEQVIEFYFRGGDFPADGNLGPGIENRVETPDDIAALIAFLKALSDDRVRFERAPFDHPELCVPVGHLAADTLTLVQDTSDPQFTSSAAERWAGIPAVGQRGNSTPLQTFQELLTATGSDGSRTHAMKDACTVPSLQQ